MPGFYTYEAMSAPIELSEEDMKEILVFETWLAKEEFTPMTKDIQQCRDRDGMMEHMKRLAKHMSFLRNEVQLCASIYIQT